MSTIPIDDKLVIGPDRANIDGRYKASNNRPYTSVAAAEAAINLVIGNVGLTVLVADENDPDYPKAKEYWVQPKGTTPETYGLVEKGAGVTDYNDLDNKPTIGDGTNTALPIVGNVKVSATTATGENAGVTVTPGQNTGEIEMQFTLPKGADGQNGQDGAPGADAVNPFKGYYPSGVNKPTTGAVGDYLYAPPSDSQSTATATIWHYDSLQTPPWTDTEIDVSAVVALEFGSGQSVPATKIKDENGVEVSGPADIFSAEAGQELNAQINGSSAGSQQEVYDLSQVWVTTRDANNYYGNFTTTSGFNPVAGSTWWHVIELSTLGITPNKVSLQANSNTYSAYLFLTNNISDYTQSIDYQTLINNYYAGEPPAGSTKLAYVVSAGTSSNDISIPENARYMLVTTRQAQTDYRPSNLTFKEVTGDRIGIVELLGNEPLQTTAQTLTGAVNELKEGLDNIGQTSGVEDALVKIELTQSGYNYLPFNIVAGKKYRVTNYCNGDVTVKTFSTPQSASYIQELGAVTKGSKKVFTASDNASYIGIYKGSSVSGYCTFEPQTDLLNLVHSNEDRIGNLDYEFIDTSAIVSVTGYSINSLNIKGSGIIYVSDLHGYLYPLEYAGKIWEKINPNRGSLNSIPLICGGDVPNNRPNDFDEYTDYIALCQKYKVFLAIGQHEVGFTTDNGTVGREKSLCKTHEYIFDNYISPMKTTWGLSDLSTIWYYKDISSNGDKIRLIVLYQYNVPLEDDPNDGTKYKYDRSVVWYGQAQITWLCDTLASTPSGRRVVILMHQPDSGVTTIGSKFFTNNGGVANKIINGNIISDIVGAFINKTTLTQTYYCSDTDKYPTNEFSLNVDADFSNSVGKFAFYLFGDLHYDYVGKVAGTPDQLAIGLTSSSVPTDCVVVKSNNNLYRESKIVTAIGYNFANGKVKLARVGQTHSINMEDRSMDVLQIPSTTPVTN